MAKVLNLGKVTGEQGPAGKDGTINGLNKVTISGADGINVTTSSEEGVITVSGADIVSQIPTSDKFVATDNQSRMVQFQIPNDVDVPIWINNNAKLYTRYYTNYENTGLINIAGGNPNDFIWYYFDGLNIIATCNLTKKIWTSCIVNDTFSGWSLLSEGGNAGKVNGRHSGRIATQNTDGSYFDSESENINDAYIQYDGNKYFVLKTNGGNLTMVDNCNTIDNITSDKIYHSYDLSTDVNECLKNGNYMIEPDAKNVPLSCYALLSVEASANGTWVIQRYTNVNNPLMSYIRSIVNGSFNEWHSVHESVTTTSNEDT